MAGTYSRLLVQHVTLELVAPINSICVPLLITELVDVVVAS
jgi:hypothetical protein